MSETETQTDNLPEIKVNVEDIGAARKKITLEIPQERIQAKITEAYGELQRDAVLPGFRKGRAPKRLIEKRFGGELRNTVKGQVVAEGYQKAIEDNKLDAIGEPEVDLAKVELPESGSLTVTMEVEVTPEFELPNLEGLEVKKPKLEASDERLNLAVENLRRHFGNWVDADAGATENDVVLADVKVQDPDNNIITEQPMVQLAVKEGNIAGVKFADLGEKLKGATPNSTVTLKGTAPEDHPQESLRNKELTITISVKEVKHLKLPEVNEEFATMLGFDSVDQLKGDLRERLVVQLEQETKNAMAQQVYRFLLGHTKLELPPNLSNRQMVNVLRRRATEMMQRGVPEADIAQHIDQLRISSAQQAAVDLKLFFILSKLGEQYGVEVSEAELNARIAQMSEMYGRRPEKLKSELAQRGQLEQLYLQVRDGKVVDKIVESAKVTEVDEKTLAEEFKNLPPLTGIGPNVEGVSQSGNK